MDKKKDDPAKEHSCSHAHIEIVGGGGDENGFYDTFECISCGWTFDLLTDGKNEF